MLVQRGKSSEEYKSEAVELANKIGFSKAAKELGINPNNITRWRDRPTGGEAERIKSMRDLEKENAKLRKEIGYLKIINDVLKKSTAILSQDQIKNI